VGNARSKSQKKRESGHVGGAQMAQAWNGQQPSLPSPARRNSRDTRRAALRCVLSHASDLGLVTVSIGFDPLFNSSIRIGDSVCLAVPQNLLLPVHCGGGEALRSGIGKSWATPLHFHV